jgi:hypothetical protein
MQNRFHGKSTQIEPDFDPDEDTRLQHINSTLFFGGEISSNFDTGKKLTHVRDFSWKKCPN